MGENRASSLILVSFELWAMSMDTDSPEAGDEQDVAGAGAEPSGEAPVDEPDGIDDGSEETTPNPETADESTAAREEIAETAETIANPEQTIHDEAGVVGEDESVDEDGPVLGDPTDRGSDDLADRAVERARNARRSGESAQDELAILERHVDDIVQRAERLNERGTEAQTNVEAGAEHARDLLRDIEELAEYRDEVEENVEQLVVGMEEIRDVASVIEDVADRTNILAMNAAIEAARAKQGGEGFGVVADEVKALAAQTGERVDQIDETIDRMSDASGGSVVALEELDERLETSAESARESLASVERVAEAIGSTTDGAGEIAETAATSADVMHSAAEAVEKSAAASVRTEELAGALTDADDQSSESPVSTDGGEAEDCPSPEE